MRERQETLACFGFSWRLKLVDRFSWNPEMDDAAAKEYEIDNGMTIPFITKHRCVGLATAINNDSS